MKYEIIVVGGGHAGCEAALASAKKGHKTLLISGRIGNIATMPCNPSIGGSAKGIVVREIDALGGMMGKVADLSQIQMKMLNYAKGPAVQALRGQIDKVTYPKKMLEILQKQENLEILEGIVEDLIVENNTVKGIVLEDGKTITSDAVILTTGTYLKSDILIGDKIHVKQIINNILSNAIKYTEKGSINFNIKCINKKNNCLLFITVTDTGRGIKKEYINKLFTKFERLDVEKNTTTEGTGLGLAITKKLVEMMGGKINVESTYGKGSMFMITIPQKIGEKKILTNTENLKIIAKKAKLKSIDYSKKRILIVDDNELNIKVARRAIESLKFNLVDECYNGKEALEKIKNNHYDIILMDIMMPVMSGITAINELKKDKNFKTPVIALTADVISGAHEKYILLGFSDYITKPFNKETIKEKIDNCLIK